MVEDKQLMRQYADERSEAAFAELVRRHLKMVYAAALRHVNGDTHLAEDVAQKVFADFARKAKTLQHRASIAGWLFLSARFVAANAVRGEARRRAREQEVVAMNEINLNGNEDWNELRPLIDEALGELGESDRESIVLRYFQGYEFSLVGAALGVSENAARMRVDRALEKLRGVLHKRGLTTTAVALGTALVNTPGAVVPTQLAATITSAVTAQSALTAAVATPSILSILAMKKFAGIAIGVAAVALVAVVTVQSLSKTETRNKVTARPAEARIFQAQIVESGTLAHPASNHDAFQKAVQGHDAQVRARKEEEETKWFDDSLKEEPGLKKFGAFARALVRPGETLVTGGWTTADGTRLLVFVTPNWIDLAGNKAVPPLGNRPVAVTIDTKFAAGSEGGLMRLGLGDLFASQNKSTLSARFSAEQVRTIFVSLQRPEGSDIWSFQRVTTEPGRECHIAIADQVLIGGKIAEVGPSVNVTPSLSADGFSIELVVMAKYTETTPGAEYTVITPHQAPATAAKGDN